MPFARSLSNGGIEQRHVLRALQVEDLIDIRGVLVHAISDNAKAFYLDLGMVVPRLRQRHR